MVNYKFIAFLFIAFIFSCKAGLKESNEIPNSVLNKHQMVDILTECYLAEGASGINIKSASGQQLDSVYLFNPIKDNKCSKTKFDSSITFYTQHPLIFKEMRPLAHV